MKLPSKKSWKSLSLADKAKIIQTSDVTVSKQKVRNKVE